MARLVPAILSHSRESFFADLRVVRQLTGRMQLDVIDGEFADNKTVQPAELDPVGTELKLDVDLMAVRPTELLQSVIKLRPQLVIVHVECEEKIEKILDRLKVAGTQAGLAFNPDTPLKLITPHLERLSHVLVMGVPAGFSGQKLQPSTLTRAGEIRTLAPDIEIGIDGGVTQDNIGRIVAAGFDIINVNSAIFGADDPLEAYSKLLEAVL